MRNPEELTRNFENSVSENPSNLEFRVIAKKFSISTSFVPCFGNSEKKKVPCKNTKKWEEGWIGREDLEAFDMEMLAIVLGNKYLVIDCDGHSAITELNKIVKENNLELPETLQVSSRDGRIAYFFKIPEINIKYKQIKTGEGEQLEFRTGKQYQVVAGIHPETKKPYKTNGLYKEIEELPESWINYLNEGKKEIVNPLVKQSSKNEINQNDEEFEIIPPSLYCFLSRTSKNLIRFGVTQGSRNVGCFNFAADILGTVERLNELRIKYSGDAEELYSSVYKLIPGKDSFTREEFNNCWLSASTENRNTVKEDKYFLQTAGIWEEEYKPGLSLIDIEDSVDIRLGENPTKQKIQALVTKYRQANKAVTISDTHLFVDEVYREITNFKGTVNPNNPIYQEILRIFLEEEIQENQKLSFQKNLEKISSHKYKKINIPQFIEKLVGNDKADNIISKVLRVSKIMTIPEEYSLSSLLVVISSLLPKNIKFLWNADSKVPPNVFLLLVAPPSYGKDVIFKRLTKPLHKIAIEANNQYIIKRDAYKQALSDWNGMNKGDKDEYIKTIAEQKGLFIEELTLMEKRTLFFESLGVEENPKKMHPYLINNATIQSITKDSGIFKNYGLLINPSEIADFLDKTNTVNKNKSGMSAMIPIWNGESTLNNLKTEGLETQADYYQVSMISGIQNGRFKQYVQPTDDDDSGIVSRCLFLSINDPITIPTLTRGEVEDISQDLEKFYLNFQEKMYEALPEISVFDNGQEILEKTELTIYIEDKSNVRDLLETYRNRLDAKAESIRHENQAAFQWFRRLPENVARLAMIIHTIRFYYGQESNLSIMSYDSLIEAIKLGDFFESQYQILTEVIVNPSNTSPVDAQDTFLYYEMLEACKNVSQKKNKIALMSSDFMGHSILKRKKFLERYGNGDKKIKVLNKPQLFTCFEEMEKLGLGLVDKEKGTFTPNLEMLTSKD